MIWRQTGPASSPPSSLTRSGKDILPLVDSRISSDAGRVAFYGEVYGTDVLFGEDGAFLVVAGFREPGADVMIDSTQRFFRKKSGAVLLYLLRPASHVTPFRAIFERVTKDCEFLFRLP